MSQHRNRRMFTAAALLAVVFVLAPSVIAAPASAEEPCEVGHLCLYSGLNYQGGQMSLTECELVDLRNSGWNGQIRSFINNQTTGTEQDPQRTVATFYTWTPLGWVAVLTSTASDAQPVVPQGLIIDGLKTC